MNPGCRSSAFRAAWNTGPGIRITALLVPGYRCAATRKVPESRQLLKMAPRQETYPLWAVSNVLRADIGHGIYRSSSPIASRSQLAGKGSQEQEGLGPPF